MRRKRTPGGYRILRISHFLRAIPRQGRITGTVGITGRTGTGQAVPEG